MKKLVILILGLPGSGKTTLARELNRRISSCWFNADDVRSSLSSDLGFTKFDRVEQARRMGSLAYLALLHSPVQVCIVDFVNPTTATRQAFLDVFENHKDYEIKTIFMDTISKHDCRFTDTAKLFDFDLTSDLTITHHTDIEVTTNSVITVLGLSECQQ